MALVSVRSTRPRQTRHILAERKLLLAVAAGGRCEFRGCNKYLFDIRFRSRASISRSTRTSMRSARKGREATTEAARMISMRSAI